MGVSESSADKSAYMTLGFMFGLIGGIAGGLAAGMLVAPKSGRETREQLKAKAIETREKARHQMAEKREMMMRKADQAKSTAKDVAARTRNAKDAASDELNES